MKCLPRALRIAASVPAATVSKESATDDMLLRMKAQTGPKAKGWNAQKEISASSKESKTTRNSFLERNSFLVVCFP